MCGIDFEKEFHFNNYAIDATGCSHTNMYKKQS
jgi:hypothetical protein